VHREEIYERIKAEQAAEQTEGQAQEQELEEDQIGNSA